MPVTEAMAEVTPGVAFDLSVNLESRAFMGSILEAEPSRRLALYLQESPRGERGGKEKEKGRRRRRDEE